VVDGARDIDLPGEFGSTIIHVLRGDGDLLARPDLVLEFGDRIGLLANRKDFPAMRKLFGDSSRARRVQLHLDRVGMASLPDRRYPDSASFIGKLRWAAGL